MYCNQGSKLQVTAYEWYQSEYLLQNQAFIFKMHCSGLQVTFQTFVPTCICMMCYLCLVMSRYIAESTVLSGTKPLQCYLTCLHHSDTLNMNTVCAQNMIMLYNTEDSLCVNRPKDFLSLLCAQCLKLATVCLQRM